MAAASMHYFEPNFLDEALVVLDRYGTRARALAGGTRLGPTLRESVGDVVALVNLKRIPALASTAIDDGHLRIGALVTAAELARTPSIAESVPLLSAAAASMGSRQLRALATVGGNVCSGDSASDLTVALLASDAICVLAALNHGERRVPLSDFLIPGGTSCAPGELLVAIEVPVSKARTAYRKMMTRRAFEMAIVGVAVALEDDEDLADHKGRPHTGRDAEAASYSSPEQTPASGRRPKARRFRDVRIAIAGAGPTSLRARQAEKSAIELPSEGDSREWAQRIADVAAKHDAAPETDDRAGADYRRHLVRVLAARALLAALEGGA